MKRWIYKYVQWSKFSDFFYQKALKKAFVIKFLFLNMSMKIRLILIIFFFQFFEHLKNINFSIKPLGAFWKKMHKTWRSVNDVIFHRLKRENWAFSVIFEIRSNRSYQLKRISKKPLFTAESKQTSRVFCHVINQLIIFSFLVFPLLPRHLSLRDSAK